MAGTQAAHKAADGIGARKWTDAELVGARPCRRCGGLIHWAEVASDEIGMLAATGATLAHERNRKRLRKSRMRPLDPDLMPHGCS